MTRDRSADSNAGYGMAVDRIQRRAGARTAADSLLGWLVSLASSPRHSRPAASAPGQLAAFEQFFNRYEREVFGYLWRVTGDEQTAGDLTQETFVRGWQHFDRIQGYEQPGGWLFRVATNLALNHLRQRKSRAAFAVTVENAEVANDDGDLAGRIERRETVRAILMDLPDQQRMALVLREVYGLSCREVGSVLGISTGAARTALWRGREQFRERYLTEEKQR